MNKALITNLISGEYTLYDLETKETFLAKPRGIFRNGKQNIKVGDYCEYEKESPFSIITKIMPRKTDLIRPAIANVDQAIVVTSLKEPDLNLNLLDRFLAILEYNDIFTLLIFTKPDLLNDNEKEATSPIVSYYQQIGYDTFIVSNKEKILTDTIKLYLKNKISVVIGQSGVGKSSFLNLINEEYHLQTNAISKALNRGKHTTRYTVLLPYEEGWLADSPGFGALDMSDFDEQKLSQSFKEFFEMASKCKYNGCIHLSEPGCFVKEEVKKNHILRSRYDNYIQLLGEIKNKRKW